MDIDEFYDEDERRRSSAELEFGREWVDRYGIRHELNWVEDTGELYVVREPVTHEWADPFGGIHVKKDDETVMEGMTVAVVAVVPDRATVEKAINGWAEAMVQPDSVEWLVERLRAAGLLGPADPSSPLVT